MMICINSPLGHFQTDPTDHTLTSQNLFFLQTLPPQATANPFSQILCVITDPFLLSRPLPNHQHVPASKYAQKPATSPLPSLASSRHFLPGLLQQSPNWSLLPLVPVCCQISSTLQPNVNLAWARPGGTATTPSASSLVLQLPAPGVSAAPAHAQHTSSSGEALL